MTTPTDARLDEPGDDAGLVAARLIDVEAIDLAEDWRQLCRWDPELPPEVEPPAPGLVIAAVADALRHPQPLGWGPDPQLAEIMDEFTDRAGPLAVCELVCLREALRRRLQGRLPANEEDETWSRLQMTVDRAMSCAARRGFEQLERAACVDALTGVLNRRAFERDVRREIGRCARHGGIFSVAMIDVDGLKAINDSKGHGAGDSSLRAVARALLGSIRGEDTAYRIGGDEFAALLPEATSRQAETVMARVAAASPTGFTWGVANCPVDGPTIETLLASADARLYRRRARARRS
jgi:diguanylate cyclase (GGDEF)-like protein